MKNTTAPFTFLVFDVESIGLHGEAFAFGYVVLVHGERKEGGYGYCDPSIARGSDHNRAWVKDNVPMFLPTAKTTTELKNQFWAVWRKWEEQGAMLVADCAWPVEARFLAECVDIDPAGRQWKGPYPLLDLGSMKLAKLIDPLATDERLPEELPAHNPYCDALQSARQLMEIFPSDL